MSKQLELLKNLGKRPDLMKPVGNYITIRLFQAEDKSLGGILLPEQVRDREKPMIAEVLAVGPGLRSNVTGDFLPVQVEVGDIVILLRHAPVEVKLAGEVFHVIAEGDVVCRINRETFDEIKAEVEKLLAPQGTVVEEDETSRAVETASGLIVVESK